MGELCGARLSRENVQIVRLTGGENVLGAEQALSARMWTVFEIALQARVVSWSQCEQFQLCTRSHCTPNCAVCTSRTIKVAEELCTSLPNFVPTLCRSLFTYPCQLSPLWFWPLYPLFRSTLPPTFDTFTPCKMTTFPFSKISKKPIMKSESGWNNACWE